MKELPDTDEAVAQWCRDIFVAKVHVERTFLPFYCFFPLTVNKLQGVLKFHICQFCTSGTCWHHSHGFSIHVDLLRNEIE